MRSLGMLQGLSLRDLLAPWLQLKPSQERKVGGLALDSGKIAAGNLFVALAGARRHGLEFIDDALARGAAAVLAEPAEDSLLVHAREACAAAEAPLLLLDDAGANLSAIAGRYYGEPSQALQVVGVTGTDGKTSVSQFLAQALSDDVTPCGVIGTLGYGLLGALVPEGHTTPDAVTVQSVLADVRNVGAKHAVMEVSSHALVQQRVAGVRFAVAVLTNLTRDHLDYHGSLEAYADAKARLFHSAGLERAVLNRDDAFSKRLMAELAPGVEALTYTLNPKDAHATVVASELELTMAGMRLQVRVDGRLAELELPLRGRFNAANALATLTALLALDFPLDDAVARLAKLTPVPGRMECFGGGGQPQVVVDYAHTPAALEAALTALREHVPGRVWCVFGCGGDRDPGKRAQMAAVTQRHADEVVITDDNPRSEDPDRIIEDILQGLTFLEPFICRDRGEAIRLAVAQAEPGDAVLVAGKGHERDQLIGERRLPFDDRLVVEQALKEAGACSR